MRHRLIASMFTATVLTFVITACTSTSTTAPPSSNVPGLAEQSSTVDSVDVKARPIQVDGSGAAFAIVLDTHSGSLAADLAASSRLEVGGADWPGVRWEGDPPGGHHRAGTLRFNPGGPANGTVKLTIGGLSAPVEFTWQSSGP